MSFTSNIQAAVQKSVDDAKKHQAANDLDSSRLTLDTKQVLAPGDMTNVLDQAAAESWNVTTAETPWMTYALYGAAAYLVWKLVFKK